MVQKRTSLENVKLYLFLEKTIRLLKLKSYFHFRFLLPWKIQMHIRKLKTFWYKMDFYERNTWKLIFDYEFILLYCHDWCEWNYLVTIISNWLPKYVKSNWQLYIISTGISKQMPVRKFAIIIRYEMDHKKWNVFTKNIVTAFKIVHFC